jgi:hypothetical protein
MEGTLQKASPENSAFPQRLFSEGGSGWSHCLKCHIGFASRYLAGIRSIFSRGKTDAIAKALLKRDQVIYVGKSIGQHTIDIRVKTILEDNAEILRMRELQKATWGIRDVVAVGWKG